MTDVVALDRDAANAAHRQRLCVDCREHPPSAGRTRCHECHLIHQNVTAGYDQ